MIECTSIYISVIQVKLWMRQDAKEATRYIISTVPLPADKRVKIRKIRKLRNNGKAVSKN